MTMSRRSPRSTDITCCTASPRSRKCRRLRRRWRGAGPRSSRAISPISSPSEDGKIVGYSYAGPYRPRIGYRFSLEDSIYIDPGEVGRGIGRALLARVIERSTELGYRQMIAVIGGSETLPSIRLHAALGFAHIGLFPGVGFKFGRWIDSVYMQRALGPGNTTLPG
jgi:L-amino acid N-acyltransferase YncA